MWQVFVKLGQGRSSAMTGPYSFASKELREEFVKGPTIYWYHFAEEDDWHSWRRGGAWSATQEPGPADRINQPPEITEDDRW